MASLTCLSTAGGPLCSEFFILRGLSSLVESHFSGPLFLHLVSPAGQETSFCGGSGLQESEMDSQGGQSIALEMSDITPSVGQSRSKGHPRLKERAMDPTVGWEKG